MTTITGFTPDAIRALIGPAFVAGRVSGSALILTTQAGDEITIPNVAGGGGGGSADLTGYAKTADVVPRAGDVDITGVKAFKNSPTVPLPTQDAQAATKAYVDQRAGQAGSGTALIRYYDPSSQSWPARGSAAQPILWVSTQTVNAPQPSEMPVGDMWIQHPDSATA